QTTNIGKINLSFKKGSVRGFIKKTDESNESQIGLGSAKVSLIAFETKTGFLMTSGINPCNKNLERNFYTQISDADGSFEFRNVKVGSYKLSSYDEVNGLGFFKDSVLIKEGQSVELGVINLEPPSALIRIEDENNPGHVLSVTNKNRVKAIFYYGDFLKELKLSVNSPVDNSEWEDINQNRDKIIDLVKEGNYTINVKFRDILCRETPIYSANIFLDKTPPVLKELILMDTNEDYINKDNIKIGISVSDNYSNYMSLRMRKIIVDEGEISGSGVDSSFFEKRQISDENYKGEFVESISGNSGKKIFLIQFKDEAGNESEVYRRDFYFDNIAPEVEIKIDGAKNINGTDTVNSSTINLKIRDIAKNKAAPIDKIKVFFNNDAEPEQWDNYKPLYPVTLPVINGYVDIKVRVMDKAKNISNLATKRMMIDTALPQIASIKINGDLRYTNKQKVNIEIIGRDISEMMISNSADFSDAVWTAYSPIISDYDIGSGEGVHHIYFKFRDAVGNETNIFVSEIILDTIPPCNPEDVNISNSRYSTRKNRYFTNTHTPLFSWQYNCNDFSEIERFKIEITDSLNNIVFSEYTYSNNITVPYIKDGDYLVRVYSIDKAGNVSIWAREDIYLVIDTISPTTPKFKKPVYTKTKLPTHSDCFWLGYIDVDISVMPSDDNITDFKFQISGGYNEKCSDINRFTNINELEGQLIDEDTVRFYIAQNYVSTLMIRGVDEAGNYSDIDSITIVEDSKEPGYVENLKGENADSKVLISWEPPSFNMDYNKDIGGYLLYYGYDARSLNGNFANEGSSPINVGKPCSIKNGKEVCQFWLTGLPNATPFLVDVAAYDDTKPQPNIGSITYQPVEVVAGVISPDLITEVTQADVNIANDSTFEAVDERDGLLYFTVGNKNGNGGIYIADISKPSKPVLLGFITMPQFKTMHQLKLYGRYAFVANGENGVVIFDVSKPDNIRILNEIAVPQNTFAVGLDNNDRYLFIVTNGPYSYVQNSSLLIYDISNISTPQKIKTLSLAIQNVQSINLQGRYLYIGSGEKLLYGDISDISNISFNEIGNRGASAIDGSMFLSDLYTVDSTNLVAAQYDRSIDKYVISKTISINDIGFNVISEGQYFYVSTYHGIKILRNYGNYELLAGVKFDNNGHLRNDPQKDTYFYITHNDIKVSKTLLFATYSAINAFSSKSGIKIFSLANPRNPKKVTEYFPDVLTNSDISVYKDQILLTHLSSIELGRFQDTFWFKKLDNFPIVKYTIFYDGKVYAVTNNAVILYISNNFKNDLLEKRIFSLDNPSNKEIISAAVMDNYLFIGIDNDNSNWYNCIEEIRIVDIRDMSLKNTINIGNCPATTMYYDQKDAFAFYSNYLYVAASGRGIQIYDISNIESLVLKNTYTSNGAEAVKEITIYGRELYYSSNDYLGSLLKALLKNPENPEFNSIIYSNGSLNMILPCGEFVYAGNDFSFNAYQYSDNTGSLYSMYNYNTTFVVPAITGNIAYLS
ncbi:MAG: hypothetical protein ACP5QK_12915, partial [Myxococcota bacterium]